MQTTKFDILIAGRSTAVRLPNPILAAFKAKAADLKLTAGKAAQTAQREHNGTLAEAITKWVGDVPLHTTRESYIGAAVELMRPVFEKRGYPLPAKIRATIAFTSKGHRGNRRGECWSPEASADQGVEIMICLREHDTTAIVSILTHELCHAAQGLVAKERAAKAKTEKQAAALAKQAGGHGAIWKEVAAALDLKPSPKTAKSGKVSEDWTRTTDVTVCDPAWLSWAQPIIDALGVCPHAAIAAHIAKKEADAKQTTRMLKLECTTEAARGNPYVCGAVWRMSSKHIANKARLSCPCCGVKIDNPHYEGADEELDEEFEADRVREMNKPSDRATTQQALDKAVAEDDFVTARRLRDQLRDTAPKAKLTKFGNILSRQGDRYADSKRKRERI